MLNVPMHQARIPISGGGGYRGNIDLTERFEENPLIQALMLVQQLKQQKQQSQQGKIVTSGGRTLIVFPNGEVKDTGIKASPKVTELLKMIEMARGTQYEEATEAEKAVGKEATGRLSRQFGIGEEPAPTPSPTRAEPTKQPKLFFRGYGEKGEKDVFESLMKGKPRTSLIGQAAGAQPRKKVESKERPSKPKEYPNAKWSEEHQMWTIVKNGRLMGVK